LVEPEVDLWGIDIVIISRGMQRKVERILDYCKNHKIPTIYMIDDNWLSIAHDWPHPYAEIFSPGMAAYNIFMKCITQCDVVLDSLIVYMTTSFLPQFSQNLESETFSTL